MKIYTRKGDEGNTGLYGGSRLSKSALRIEAYGTIDELNSWIGVLKDQTLHQTEKDILLRVQNSLFVMGSHLSADPSKDGLKLPSFDPDEDSYLEKEIDRMEQGLPEMKNFILPGGHTAVSFAHVARCVCRRAERRVVELHEKEKIDSHFLKYLNRLSDMLFVLSRKIAKDLGAPEIPWQPDKKG